MKNKYYIFFILIWFFGIRTKAQGWTLKLRSTVELRTFKLTNKVDVVEEKLAGATIALFKGSSIINQVQSDGGGDFVIDVPANGDFILTVSYSGCNAKKFQVSTMGVPEDISKDNYKPSFGIEGVVMAKAFPTVDYSILKQPLVKIAYTSNGKRFDDEQSYTNQMLGELSRIRDAENVLINNFTSTNNTGDVALSKGDCPLAKASYEKAMTIIPGERYPSEQLPKVGDCLKQKELADKKAADETKSIAEKIEADKLAKEKAAQEKIQNDKLAKEKLAQEKIEKDKQTKDKVEADKIAKSKVEAAPPAKEKTTSPTKEQTTELTPSSSSSEPSSAGVNTGDAKYSIPQALGTDKYKTTIKRADELFKMKRYAEAKPMYEEALTQKPNDPAATNKLAEIERLTVKK